MGEKDQPQLVSLLDSWTINSMTEDFFFLFPRSVISCPCWVSTLELSTSPGRRWNFHTTIREIPVYCNEEVWKRGYSLVFIGMGKQYPKASFCRLMNHDSTSWGLCELGMNLLFWMLTRKKTTSSGILKKGDILFKPDFCCWIFSF